MKIDNLCLHPTVIFLKREIWLFVESAGNRVGGGWPEKRSKGWKPR